MSEPTSGAKVNSNGAIDDTPIHVAVKNGDLEIVRLILDRDIDIDAKDGNGRTPLYIAVEYYAKVVSQMDMTRLLLEHGADINATSLDRKSPLNYAVQLQCLEMVVNLLNYGANINCVDSNGYTPLHLAVEIADKEAITLLLNRGAIVDMKDNFNNTPLHLALLNEDIEIIELLLEQGANANTSDDDGTSLLHCAAAMGQVQIVECLLNYGANVNCAQNYGRRTPLHIAAEKGNTLLINRGANIEAKEKINWTPLYMSVGWKADLEIVRIILDKGADVDAKDVFGRTPLYWAITHPNLNMKRELTKLLLERGASANVSSHGSSSPIHFAVSTGCLHTISHLLNYGANINSHCKSCDNFTPLHIAAKMGDVNVIKLLLWRGAYIDSQDDFGRTALHIACMDIWSTYDKDDIIITLLEYGSDINIRCKNNNTPLDYAIASIKFGQFSDHIFEAFLPYMVFMNTAYIYAYLSSKNCNWFWHKNSYISILLHKCEAEIARMKSEKIKNTRISFYDILVKGTNSLAMYVRNDKIAKALKSVYYAKRYPIYWRIIEKRYKKGMERKELFEKSTQIVNFIYPKLPYLCTDKILSYLSVEELTIYLGVKNVFQYT